MSNDERRQKMVEVIKSRGKWARITPTVWCLKVENNTSAEIRDFLKLKYSINEDERVMVINITNSGWASYNLSKEVADWLKEKE
jgi:hypothetical protein